MDGDTDSDGEARGSHEPEREERRTSVKDLKLPETTVVRLMKEHLPKQAIIAQESKDVMRRIGCIFGLFITDHALEVARRSKRRTLLPEDVVIALHENNFASFTEQVMPVVEKRRANFRSRKPKKDENGVTSGETENAQPPSEAASEQINEPDPDESQPGQSSDSDSGGSHSEQEDAQSENEAGNAVEDEENLDESQVENHPEENGQSSDSDQESLVSQEHHE